MRKIVVAYHGQCYDGYGAYFYAKRFFGLSWRAKTYCEVSYIPISYGTDTHEVCRDQDKFPHGSLVIFCDYCPPRHILSLLEDNKCTVLILDHHDTAAQAVKDIQEFKPHFGCANFESLYLDWCVNTEADRGALRKIFDHGRSGVGITYDFFWRTDNLKSDIRDRYFAPPFGAKILGRTRLVDYLEDRDIWKFQLPDSKEINAYIQSSPLELEEFHKLEIDLRTDQALKRVVTIGKLLLRGVDKQVKFIADNSVKIIIMESGHKMALLNITAYQSEALNYILTTRPEIDFACGFIVDTMKAQVKLSFRSRNGGLDVAAYAEGLGGGGHKAAAGANLEFKQGLTWVEYMMNKMEK